MKGSIGTSRHPTALQRRCTIATSRVTDKFNGRCSQILMTVITLDEKLLYCCGSTNCFLRSYVYRPPTAGNAQLGCHHEQRENQQEGYILFHSLLRVLLHVEDTFNLYDGLLCLLLPMVRSVFSCRRCNDRSPLAASLTAGSCVAPTHVTSFE